MPDIDKLVADLRGLHEDAVNRERALKKEIETLQDKTKQFKFALALRSSHPSTAHGRAVAMRETLVKIKALLKQWEPTYNDYWYLDQIHDLVEAAPIE